MRGFSRRRGETLAFHRDGETVEITVSALPLGFLSWLQAAFPPPERFVNGTAQAETSKAGEYNDHLTLLAILKAADPGTFEAAWPPTSAGRPAYEKTARAVLAEFRQAYFTDGEMRSIWLVVKRLSMDAPARVESRLKGPEGN